MSGSRHRIRLTVKTIAASEAGGTGIHPVESLLAHFGVRAQLSGVRSWIVQTRMNGRMRKIILGRFPELPLDAAPREGAAVLAHLWDGEETTPSRKGKAPLFLGLARRCRGGNTAGSRPLMSPSASSNRCIDCATGSNAPSTNSRRSGASPPAAKSSLTNVLAMMKIGVLSS